MFYSVSSLSNYSNYAPVSRNKAIKPSPAFRGNEEHQIIMDICDNLEELRKQPEGLPKELKNLTPKILAVSVLSAIQETVNTTTNKDRVFNINGIVLQTEKEKMLERIYGNKRTEIRESAEERRSSQELDRRYRDTSTPEGEMGRFIINLRSGLNNAGISTNNDPDNVVINTILSAMENKSPINITALGQSVKQQFTRIVMPK